MTRPDAARLCWREGELTVVTPRELAKYNPDEPRVEGGPDAGEWTTAGGQHFGGGAKVRYMDPGREYADITSKDLVGHALSDEEYARLAGAPDDALVAVTPLSNGSIRINVKGANGLEQIRILARSAKDGALVVDNNGFFVKQTKRTEGMGVRSLVMEAQQARALGVERIETYAGREDGGPAWSRMNGYYTWPRLGFDGDLPEGLRWQGVPDARRVSDLMSSDRGRAWWRKYGEGVYVSLDLKGSGYERLRAYARERGV